MEQRPGLIALVTPRYAPYIGGVERHVEALAQGLTKHGIGVEVVTTDPSGQFAPTERRDGVMVRRFRALGRQDAYFVAPGLSTWLVRHASRYTLLHAHSYHALPALQAALAAGLTGTPLVFTPHYHGTGHTWVRRMLHVPYKAAGRSIVRLARAIICVSTSERTLMQRHFGTGGNYTVIPNGVEVRHLQAAPPFEKPVGVRVVLSVGRLEAYKQINRLLLALPHLPGAYRLVIIGEGAERTRLQQLVDSLGLGERVRLLGHVSASVLHSWYRTADVVVSMSLHEAFGITLLEGAAAGAAVIATEIEAHHEVASYLAPGAVSFVTPGISGEELARTILAVSIKPRTGSGTSSYPTWSKMVDETVRCYNSVTTIPALCPEVES